MGESNSTRRRGFEPHLALIAVQVMFGTWPIFGKIALRDLPSTGLVAFRVAGAAVAFAAIRRLTKDVPIRGRGDYARLALYSLLGVALNQLLFTRGLALSTVINATLLGTAIPVFTLLVSVILGYESLSPRSALGTVIAAAGVVYLVDPLRADFTGGTATGNLLLVANTLSYGAYIAVSQDVFRRYGALVAMSWLFAFAGVVTVPLGGYYLAQVPLAGLAWSTWLAVLYIILVPTVGAYYLNAWALERVSPSTVAVYIYLQPLIAFALAPLLLGAGEQLNSRTLVASALIFAGVAIVTLRSHSRVMEEVSEHPDALGH